MPGVAPRAHWTPLVLSSYFPAAACSLLLWGLCKLLTTLFTLLLFPLSSSHLLPLPSPCVSRIFLSLPPYLAISQTKLSRIPEGCESVGGSPLQFLGSATGWSLWHHIQILLQRNRTKLGARRPREHGSWLRGRNKLPVSRRHTGTCTPRPHAVGRGPVGGQHPQGGGSARLVRKHRLEREGDGCFTPGSRRCANDVV